MLAVESSPPLEGSLMGGRLEASNNQEDSTAVAMTVRWELPCEINLEKSAGPDHAAPWESWKESDPYPESLSEPRCKQQDALCFPKSPLATVLRVHWAVSQGGKGSPVEEAVGTFQARMTAQVRDMGSVEEKALTGRADGPAGQESEDEVSG